MKQRVRSILIVASVGLITAVASFAVLLVAYPYQSGLVHPGGPHEGLCLESSQVNSSTNVTLNLLNCGYPYTTTLISYYVHWQQSLYSNTNWSGPSIPMNAHASVNILIDGQAFTFQPGNSYEIDLISAQGTHFGLTIIT